MYATNFNRGAEYQDFVTDTLAETCGLIVQLYTSKAYQFSKGESRQGIEIKLDSLCTKTGRLSIEVAEKSNSSVAFWTPSGIWRDDNTWLYVQGNYDCLFIFSKKFLRVWEKTARPEYHEEHGTLRAYYLPINEAKKIALKSVEPD